jgi:Protein of unknown function (DUF3592)
MVFFNLLVSLLLIGCIPVLLFAGGLLVTFVGFWALRREFAISKHGLIVPGTVIAIDARRKRTRRRGHATVYDAIVRFQTPEGDDPVTFIVNTGSFRVYHVDQPVRVIYVPTEQKNARIDGRLRWMGPWALICFGLVFMALTVILSVPRITISH